MKRQERKPRIKKREHEAGFTLFETLVVMSLLSLTLTTSSYFSKIIANRQLTHVVKQTKTFIEAAKEMAVLTNNAHVVRCKKGTEGYVLQEVIEGTAYREYELPKQIQAGIGTQEHYPSKEGDLPNTTSFKFSKGMSPSRSGTLWLRHQLTEQLIEVTVRPVTGKVTIYEERREGR